MKTSRYKATKAFKLEMLKYEKEFRQWCLRETRFYQSEFRELIAFGLSYGLPTEVVHHLIQIELQKVLSEIVWEARQLRAQLYSEELQSKIANYTPTPILTFSPQEEFLKYLDTVDYKVVDLSAIKSRGYCFGLSVPEIEVIVEEHRTRI